MQENSNTIRTYSERADSFIKQYEGLTAEQVHPYMDIALPKPALSVLDVGAGSGRDAAWFADQGIDVVALEPADGLREQAKAHHADKDIHWVSDKLPELGRIHKEGYRFDFIMLSAVWMHIPPEKRGEAFDALSKLVKPGGKILITLRHGPSPEGRTMYPVSTDELHTLSEKHFGILETIDNGQSSDQLGRSSVYWEQVVTHLPGGYQDALTWLKDIVRNDRKSSTYKVGLLRSVKEVLQRHPESVRDVDDFTVSIPLAHVTREWLTTYQNMSELDIPQLPGEKKMPSFPALSVDTDVVYTGDEAKAIGNAFLDARRRIKTMPVKHVRHPHEERGQVFSVHHDPFRSSEEFVFNDDFVASFGELHLGKDLAKVLVEYADLVEAGLFHEWARLSSGYADASSQGEKVALNRRMQRALYGKEFLYFAHPVSQYGTPLEAKVEAMIQKAFPAYTIENPNTAEHEANYNQEGMEYFVTLCNELQGLCFTTFLDGSMGAGVYKEIESFIRRGVPVHGILFPDNKVIAVSSMDDLKDVPVLSVEESRAKVKAERAFFQEQAEKTKTIDS